MRNLYKVGDKVIFSGVVRTVDEVLSKGFLCLDSGEVVSYYEVCSTKS